MLIHCVLYHRGNGNVEIGIIKEVSNTVEWLFMFLSTCGHQTSTYCGQLHIPDLRMPYPTFQELCSHPARLDELSINRNHPC